MLLTVSYSNPDGQAIVRGLAYLHETKHIQHRDIKAGNVLLSGVSGGGVKLCDLGVSASVAHQTKRSTQIGTPLWMSPELIKEERYGTPVDIWALGITGIEMAEQVRERRRRRHRRHAELPCHVAAAFSPLALLQRL